MPLKKVVPDSKLDPKQIPCLISTTLFTGTGTSNDVDILSNFIASHTGTYRIGTEGIVTKVLLYRVGTTLPYLLTIFFTAIVQEERSFAALQGFSSLSGGA